MSGRRGSTTSRVVERTTSHKLVVVPRLNEPTITEEQFRELSRICGDEHPGRLKEWAADFRFDVAPEDFAVAVSYAAGRGLRFRSETTIAVTYEPPGPTAGRQGEAPGDAHAATFALDAAGLRSWLIEEHALDPDEIGPEDITFSHLCSEEVNRVLDGCVAGLVDAGILREPPRWSIGVYPLDDADQWGFLVTVRVSNDAVHPGGVPFFQVAELGEDVRLEDSVQERLADMVAAANRLLPLARAAWVGTDPGATHHPDGMCKAHGDYDCGEDECRVEPDPDPRSQA